MKNVNVRKTCPCGHPCGSGDRVFTAVDPGRKRQNARLSSTLSISLERVLRSGICGGYGFCDQPAQEPDGTGTLLAFRVLCAGRCSADCFYKYGKHLPFAYAGELFGTSVIGGLLSYPVATLIMGSESAVFGFVIPFFVSSCGGTVIAAVLVTAMKKMKVFDIYLGNLDTETQKTKG